MEIEEIKSKRDGLYVTLKFNVEEIKEKAGWDVSWMFMFGIPTNTVIETLLDKTINKFR